MRLKGVSRREFLKLALLAPAAISAAPQLHVLNDTNNDTPTPNVIVLIFDAWSAKNVSLYGYSRDTMPNLAKFAEKAIVYHNHYSAGTFTVPGTSSILTGTYPWKHRAFQLGGRINLDLVENQIFSVAKPIYNTLAYTQNKFADLLLYQAQNYIDTHVRIGAFNIQNRLFYSFFKNDARMAFSGFEDNIIQAGKGFDGSLFLGPLYRFAALYDRYLLLQIYQVQYARGLPTAAGSEVFLFEDVVDGVIDLLGTVRKPSLLYLHFYPPHEPYCPKRTFWEKYKNDGFEPPRKEQHPLAQEENNYGTMSAYRRFYDEFITSWDDEFGRVYSYLESSGLLENSYVIITSDHGEMFERGESGHITPLIYDPIIHIPLIVSRPGQTQRKDVYMNTSNVDLLPTIAHITGHPVPATVEGELLPGLGGAENPTRGVFAMDAKINSSFSSLQKFSLSLTRERYRLTHYHYDHYDNFEFYDLESDPEEVNNLFSSKPSVAIDMQTELMDRLADANRAYRK